MSVLFTGRTAAPEDHSSPALQASLPLPRGPHRQHAAAVTASAARVVPSTSRAAGRNRQKWQRDAWVYRDSVPEVRYAHNFLGNAAAQVRMLPAELGSDGEEPIRFDSEECTIPPAVREAAQAALDRLTGDAAGHGVILSPVVQNFETVGECYLLGFTDPETGREEWSIRSMDELRITDEGYFLVSSTVATTSLETGRRLPDDAYVARLWCPHPQFSEWPDSPMRALLDTCEEILLAGRSRRAALRNRIAGNGVLLMPNGIITGSASPQPGTGQTADSYAAGDGMGDESDSKASKVMADLTLAMVTPIGDESAPSAVVPLMLRGDREDLKEIRHVTLDRPMTKDAEITEEKALRRLATGLDVPPEIITGLADVNHWTAWQIDLATWTHHVEPIVAASCAALTVGYLRATLLTMGFPWPIVSRVVIWYDPSNLVQDPRADEEVGETGRTPAELSTLSTTAQTLILTGFDPTAVMAALDLPELPFIGPPETSGGAFGQPTRVDSERVPETEPDEDEPPAIEQPAATRAASALARLGISPRAVTSAATTEPTEEQIRLSRRLMEIDRALRERLVGACDAALARVLERAGNRVRSAATRSATASVYRERIAGIPGQQVAGTLGPAVVAALGLDEAELLADEYARLRTQYVEWTTAASEDAIATCVRLLGADSNTEEIRRLVGELNLAFRDGIEAGWEFLQTGLGDVAEQHLYDGDPDIPDRGEIPNSLVNPSLVRGALATAGGLHTAIGGLTRDGLPGARNRGVGGLGTGELLSDFMRGQGSEIDHYEWAYGISTRPFLPHQRLDGVRFPTWGAPELDTTGTGAEWIGGSMAPGDHKGCHCDYMPVWSDGIRQRDVADEIGDLAGGRATDAAREVAAQQGPRRRTVAPTVPYRGDDAPPARPVEKAATKRTAARRPAKDEAGVPYRLTYSYLSKLTPEQHDNLVEHMSLRISDGDPRELRRFEQYEQWEEYEAGELQHLEERGLLEEDPDLNEVRRAVDDFAARNGVPGLTHNRVGGRPHTHSVIGLTDESGPSRAQVQEEYALWYETFMLEAEEATRGNLTNDRGRSRGVSTRALLTGPVDQLYRYGSEELLGYLETNRRMTWTEFYYARTGSPAFAERAAKHAAENGRINRDRTEHRGGRR
jgi:hypothetical protein